MSDDFQSVLDNFRATLAELVEQNYPNMPPEHRALLTKLGMVALDGLHMSLWQGPERLGAIKLVLQMCRLLKDYPKPS